MRLKRAIKSAAYAPLSALGAFRASRALAGGRTVILCYHRVVDGPLDAYQPGMVVSRALFRRHLEWLGRRFRFLTLEEFARGFLTDEVPAAPCAIVTFDDGWLDNYEVAFPILREMGIPATIFLPTDYIGTGLVYWQSRVERAMRAVYERRHILARAYPEEGQPARAAFVQELLIRETPLALMIDRAVLETKVLPRGEFDEVCAFLERIGDVDGDGPREIVNWDEVRAMAADGIRFGSHSASHRIMTTLSAAENQAEASGSMRVMERELGEAPTCFAYPNGDADDVVAREVRRAGYLCAVTVDTGFANRATDLFGLPRFSMHEGGAFSGAALDFLLSGLAS
ncbi:MAG: polysaccharide deacetylase family protein [Deltaproteobacteria bacterium]|nr:polysaccharide deacetylase family protein [Deltaproteobacteria bacterium]